MSYCLEHHAEPTCQPEEMLCFTCSSDEVPGELLLFSPDSALCKHARSSQRPPSIIAFQRPRPPFVVGLFRPLLSLRNFASSFFLLFRSQSASQFSAAVADGALFSPLGNFGDVSGAAINLLWWRRSGGAWATLPSLVDVPEQERRLSLPVRSNGQAPAREVAKKSGWKVMEEGY